MFGFRKCRRAVGEQPALTTGNYHLRARSQNRRIAMVLILTFDSLRQVAISVCLVYPVFVSFHSWFIVFVSWLWNRAACLNVTLKLWEKLKSQGPSLHPLQPLWPHVLHGTWTATFTSFGTALWRDCSPHSNTDSPTFHTPVTMCWELGHRLLQSTGEDAISPLASYFCLTQTSHEKKLKPPSKI